MSLRVYVFTGLAILSIFICACLSNSQTRKPENSQTPLRIISLKPNITEILFALGVGDKVVGVTTWCDHPDEARKLPKVADYISINTEKIIALKPDLVIGSEENSVKEPFKVLESAGIKTLFVPFRTMEDLYSSIWKIADAVEKAEEGKKMVGQIRRVIASVAKQSPEHNYTQEIATPVTRARNDINLNTPSILMLVGHRPLVAAGPDTFLGDLIKLIGAKNIIDGEKTPYPTINTEFILAKDPDIIIDLGMGSETGQELPEMLKERVIKFNMSDFRAGPRIVEAVKKLHAVILRSKIEGSHTIN